MNDFEEQLRRTRLAAPSDALDRRMGAAFAAAAGSRRLAHRPPSPWVLVAFGALCGVAVTAIFYWARPPRPEDNHVAIANVSRSETPAHFVRLLLEPGAKQRALPAYTVRISIH